jgi:hypothetical protein
LATWIVHLRLAENLLGMIEGLNAADFAVGSIAPDSGIPDEKWESFTPPGEVTHFAAPPDEDGWQMLADLEFYHGYLAGSHHDAARSSFLLGYFFHLVTDNLWNEQIGRPTHARFRAEFEANPRFIWEVKHDWYGLDFIYLHEHPNWLFWRVFLNCAYTKDYLDFLPPEAVHHRIDYIQTYYRRQDELDRALHRRPDIYLTQAEMDRFVGDATQRLHRIYHYLLEEGSRTGDYTSALELSLE